MKKIIAVFLCLAMLLGCAAVSAEQAASTGEKVSIGKISINGAFDLQCAMPEGYSAMSYEYDARGRVTKTAYLDSAMQRVITKKGFSAEQKIAQLFAVSDIDLTGIEVGCSSNVHKISAVEQLNIDLTC